MSVAEMKKQIKEKIDHLDDEKALQHVLEILSTAGEQQTINVTQNIDKLFEQNDGLLKRLS